MDISAYRPLRVAAALFHIKSLELAPEGWRRCVEHVAEGFSHKESDKDFCILCGRELEGAQGHDVTCLTMVARRILANEPLLLAQRKAEFPGVDLDAAHAAIDEALTSTQRPTIAQPEQAYEIPRFLNH
jgi:hypothetical protein